ncbi:MAG: Ribose-5-phosphate isomerase A [Methanoregula sp. PtaU1.Bin051]|nr:MAG: Ribose-5-phosphate isomerase A [Methanoregula sp. PtaU1.Bin051]
MEKASQDSAKKTAGYRAADMVRPGMVIGLGTGSTVYYAMERLRERIAQGLACEGIPTSFQTALRAREYGIPLSTLDEYPEIDLAIDGADQVDPELRLIKGRGAAQTREKIVAEAAKTFVIVVDESKMVPFLNAPIPVEVLPFAATPVLLRLKAMGGEPVIREGQKKDGPVITDNGNFIIDCSFYRIDNPEEFERLISCIPGVIENGIFARYTKKTVIIAGSGKGCRILPSSDIVP